MSLWDSVRDSLQKTAEKAGSVAMVGAQKTKLNAETLLVDREILHRKQLFGVTLYDYVAPLSSTPEFYASDDKQTDTLRPPLLTAQREIAALEIKKTKIKEQQAQAQVTRRAAFPTPAQTIGGKMMNAGKSATLAANEAKLMTDMAAIETLIKAQKQEFGEKLYETLVELEDNDGWLPTDRDIRSIYDQTRRDVEKLVAKRAAKEQELASLDDPNATTKNGAQPAVYATPTVPTYPTPEQSGSMFPSAPAAAAAVSTMASSYGSTQTSVAAKIATASISNSFSSNTAPAPVAPSYTPQTTTSTVDSFATTSSAPMPTTNSFPNTTSYAPPAPAPAADPFAGAAGYAAPASANSFGGNNMATPAAPANSFGGNTYDPFAGMTSSASTTGSAPIDPFAAPADPFAGLSSGTAAQAPAPADPFAGTIFAGTSAPQGSTNNSASSQFNMR